MLPQRESEPRPLLRFQKVDLGYGARRVLKDVSFALAAGDYVAIVGSNGSGKTTLLRTLLGTLRPLAGKIEVLPNLHFGYVPQLQTVDEVFPLTVLEVTLMGRYGRLGALKRPGSEEHDRAQAALTEVGIGHLARRLYRELSGGQKQRVLIARALTNDPHVLVLDEHTNDLDITAEKAIMALIDRVHAEHNMAVVMVTHSLNTVANHSQKIGIINDGRFHMSDASAVLQTDYLQQLYNVPLRVIEVEGTKVVI